MNKSQQGFESLLAVLNRASACWFSNRLVGGGTRSLFRRSALPKPPIIFED